MADLMAARRTLTLMQLGDEATARFGPDPATWAFQCPMCGDIATAADFPPQVAAAVSIDCVGRYRGATGTDDDGNPAKADRGCSYSAHGLIPGPWEIVMPGGDRLHCFPLAPAPDPNPAGADTAPGGGDTAAAGQDDGDAPGADEEPAPAAQTPAGASAYWAVWSGAPLLLLTALHEFDTAHTPDQARTLIEKYDEPDNADAVPWESGAPYILEPLTAPRLRMLRRLAQGEQPVAWDDAHGYTPAEHGAGCRHCGKDATGHPGYAA